MGETGFLGAGVARIEKAAGLSPGAGGMYRHFSSKEQHLVEAVRERLQDWGPYTRFTEPGYAATYIRDLMPDATRVLLRDNSVPAGVLDSFRADDHDVMVGLTERTLRDLAGPEPSDGLAWRSLAEVLMGAVSYIWLIRDIYGGDHPCGIDVFAYLRSTAEAVAARIHVS